MDAIGKIVKERIKLEVEYASLIRVKDSIQVDFDERAPFGQKSVFFFF